MIAVLWLFAWAITFKVLHAVRRAGRLTWGARERGWAALFALAWPMVWVFLIGLVLKELVSDYVDLRPWWRRSR